MKKYKNLIILLLSLLFILIGIYGFKVSSDIGTSCEFYNGKWSTLYNECADINAQWCEEKGGRFSKCSSPCRNDPSGTLCIQSCVKLCRFK